MTYSGDDFEDYNNDDEEEEEENGQFNNPIIEEYENLGLDAYLNRDSGEVVGRDDIVPPRATEDDENNGSKK